MGTDIHSVLQVRDNGAWRSLAEGFSDRNYNAFAFLGDVRNGFGVAGCLTGSRIEPLSACRGLPADFEMATDDYDGDGHPVPPDFHWDREWAKKYRIQYMGDHSFSWVDGRDIERADLQAIHRHYGVISIAAFRQAGGIGHRPNSWSGGVWGRDIITLKADEILDNEEDLHPGKEIYVQTWWDEPLHEALGERFCAFLRQIQDLAKRYGPTNVRFVFGFDS